MRKRATPVLVTVILAAALLPALVNAQTDYLRQWGTYGSAPGQFNDPQGVVVDGSGNIYVADAGNFRIQEFATLDGSFLLQWGSGGTGIGQFNYPSAAARDADGTIYVADTYNNRIVKYNSSGTRLLQWGTTGTTSGKFRYPRGVAVDGDGVYVADFYNKRMQMFTHLGVFLREWGVFGENPWGVATDGLGNIFVTCNTNGYIEVFDNAGNELNFWGGFGAGNGLFSGPRGVAVDASGNVYIADAGNSRIQVFGALPVSTQSTSWGRLKALYR